MTSRPRICILSLNRIADKPRVQRQVMALSADYDVHLVGLGPRSLPGTTLHEVPFHRRGAWRKARWLASMTLGIDGPVALDTPHAADCLEVLRHIPTDLIIAHDVDAVPIALAAGTAPVLLDAHEYAPKEFEESWLWRLGVGRYRQRLCRRLLPRLAGMTCVCQGIADRYASEFGVHSEVVVNAAAYQDLAPPEAASGPIRLVHPGAAMRGRRLEAMCEAVLAAGGGFELHFHLIGDAAYIAQLARRYAGPQIHFHPPFPQAELVAGLHRYDLGAYILDPCSFNNLMALPNKFFDFIQARLGLVIAPSPEMARIVRAHGLGLVADDFSAQAFTACLRTITRDQVAAWRHAAHVAAPLWCAEQTLDVIRREVARALAKGRS